MYLKETVSRFSGRRRKKQELIGQNIPLDILYEDNDMIVINKRRGVVVHPGAGNTEERW